MKRKASASRISDNDDIEFRIAVICSDGVSLARTSVSLSFTICARSPRYTRPRAHYAILYAYTDRFPSPTPSEAELQNDNLVIRVTHPAVYEIPRSDYFPARRERAAVAVAVAAHFARSY